MNETSITLQDQICDVLETYTVSPTDDQTIYDIQNTIDAILIAGQDNGTVIGFDTAVVCTPLDNTFEVSVNVNLSEDSFNLSGSFIVSNLEDDGYIKFKNDDDWYDDAMKLIRS